MVYLHHASRNTNYLTNPYTFNLLRSKRPNAISKICLHARRNSSQSPRQFSISVLKSSLPPPFVAVTVGPVKHTVSVSTAVFPPTFVRISRGGILLNAVAARKTVTETAAVDMWVVRVSDVAFGCCGGTVCVDSVCLVENDKDGRVLSDTWGWGWIWFVLDCKGSAWSWDMDRRRSC
jgi:hypothetical protein